MAGFNARYHDRYDFSQLDPIDGAPDDAELDEPDGVLTNEGKVWFKDESKQDEDQVSEKDFSSENNTLKDESDDEDIDKATLRLSRGSEESRDLGKSRDSVKSEQENSKDRFRDMASSR